jgi:hypothetical protein
LVLFVIAKDLRRYVTRILRDHGAQAARLTGLGGGW